MADQVLVDLSELLQGLQYPHSLSHDSFDPPNFELVAGILCWMVQKLDPNIIIHDDISTRDGKMTLLNGITAELARKLNVDVDSRNLLLADGLAAKELLKVASVFEIAYNLADKVSNSEEDFQPEVILKAAEKAQSLVSEIADLSDRLSGALKNESEDSNKRAAALQFLNCVTDTSVNEGAEHDHIESHIARVLESTNAAVERVDKQCKILISNQRGMEEKIRKKTIDLERTSKRLESLKHVRPAYMDEYEQLEEELQVEYDRYVVRLRNVDYLEGELSSFKQEAIERQNKTERSMKRMQKKFREEEMRILNGCGDGESEATSIPASGDATYSTNPMKPERKAENELLSTGVDESSRTDAWSTRSTPRSRRDSFSRSGDSGSEPSSGGSGFSDGSEMTGSLGIGGDESGSDSDF